MTEKFKEWNSMTNWLMVIVRAVVILLISLGMKQYFDLAQEVRAIKLDVAVMKGNRFTASDGVNHDRRITVLEEKVINMADDIKEIKSDVKTLLRDK